MESRAIADPPRLDTTRAQDGTLHLKLAGSWRIGESLPATALVGQAIAAQHTTAVRFDSRDVVSWDSALVSFAARVLAIASAAGVTAHRDGLPVGVQRLLALGEARLTPRAFAPARPPSVLARIGMRVLGGRRLLHGILAAIGEQTLALGRLLRGQARWRGGEFLFQLHNTGASALAIVGLVAGLLGLVLAFISAAQLESLGASLLIAKLVAIAMVRELGAMMTAIVVAGRTGAAFAAELGTMRDTRELDSLTTLGLSPTEVVVLPRVLAVTLTMPLLCVYANVLGVLGGAVVGVGIMHVAPRLYVTQTLQAVSLTDLVGGLVKATTYGFLIGEAGCYMGLRAGQGARDVGKAASSGVVTSIVLVTAACALYAFISYWFGV
jgi:phospholipid/cholesterol/gamma-HCH transport system permease protein